MGRRRRGLGIANECRGVGGSFRVNRSVPEDPLCKMFLDAGMKACHPFTKYNAARYAPLRVRVALAEQTASYGGPASLCLAGRNVVLRKRA